LVHRERLFLIKSLLQNYESIKLIPRIVKFQEILVRSNQCLTFCIMSCSCTLLIIVFEKLSNWQIPGQNSDDGTGGASNVIKGLEWAANAHLEQVKAAKSGKRKGFKGSTANMSLNEDKAPALILAIDVAVDVGLHFVVAAGNDNDDACQYAPSASTKALTVGASSLNDTRANFSNVGPCVDIFGPGVDIESTWLVTRLPLSQARAHLWQLPIFAV
jgi:hypothetical protein